MPDPVLANPPFAILAMGHDPQGVKRKPINLTGHPTNKQQVVAAVAGKKIRVLSYDTQPSAACDLTWWSGTSAAISAVIAMPIYGGRIPSYNPAGWVETVAGEALNAIATGNVGITLQYIEV